MGDEIGKRDQNFVVVMLGVTDDANQYLTQLRFDPTTKRLKVVQAALSKMSDSVMAEIEGHDAVGDGNVTTTAGTAKKLSASSIPCKRVIVHAVGGHCVVGGSTCVYAEGSRRGIWIPKTQTAIFYVSDVSLLYVDSATNVLISFYYEN